MSLSSILLVTTDRKECDSLNKAFTNDRIVVHCVNTAPDLDVISFLDKALVSGLKRPSLILINLDNVNGYRTSVISAIKEHLYSSLTPLIAYSQNTDSGFIEHIYEQGAISVFKRPNNWNHFVKTILTYWAYSEVRLPNEPGEDATQYRRGQIQTGGLSYYPRSA